MNRAGAATPVVGEAIVSLYLPDDWLDLVHGDEGELRAQVAAEFAPADRDAVVQGLLCWRARPGLLSHGVVDVHEHGVDATWHVLTNVVPVPHHADVDPAALLGRLLGSGSPGAYVEAFETTQGRAVGLLDEHVPLLPDGTAAPVSAGRAVVLSLPRGVGIGLLVVGVCLDPEQLTDLAALVTTIATRSTITAALT